jgi:hypothetical protein
MPEEMGALLRELRDTTLMVRRSAQVRARRVELFVELRDGGMTYGQIAVVAGVTADDVLRAVLAEQRAQERTQQKATDLARQTQVTGQ